MLTSLYVLINTGYYEIKYTMQKKCRAEIQETIEKGPITFMNLVDNVECVSETVDVFVKELKNQGEVAERKSKFRVLYCPKIQLEKIEFFELMLTPTIKSIILLMMKTSEISQLELEEILAKSRPSISRSLKILVENGLIEKLYHAPKMTYRIQNKQKLVSWMKVTHPKIVDRMSDGLTEMFM